MIEELFNQALLQYGAIGIFCAYLIFDRQVTLKEINKTLKGITQVLTGLCNRIDGN